MRIPTIQGVINRRLLINFRVDPDVLAARLPAPFRPQLVGGCGIAGICLIRLKQVRPRWLPAPVGVSSENAAHRIAVEWESGGETRAGVYVPRRDTSSRLNAAVGGRLFPGVSHLARFDVREWDDRYRVAMHARDGSAHVSVDATLAYEWTTDSVFDSLAAASKFFQEGALGYSPNGRGELDGLELCCSNWRVEPLIVARVESSFFDDRSVFPANSVEFDCALLMRDIDHQWHSRDSLCCSASELR